MLKRYRSRHIYFYNRFAKIEKIKNFLIPNEEFFDVILKSEGISKLNTLKIMIDFLNFSHYSARDLVAILPQVVKEKVSKNEVDILKIIFEKNGNELEIRKEDNSSRRVRKPKGL